MKNKKLLSLLAVLFFTLVFGVVSLKSAGAKTCTADGVSGECEYPGGLLKSCSSSKKISKGQADCGSGGICCVLRSGMAEPASKKTCTADGVSGECQRLAALENCRGMNFRGAGQGDCSSGETCCVPLLSVKEATELKEATDQAANTANKECTANGIKGVCRTVSFGDLYPCSGGDEKEGDAPVSGCKSVGPGAEVCCVPKATCCVISPNRKDFGSPNCRSNTTACPGKIENLGCEKLLQCNYSAGTADSGNAGATGAGGPATTTTFPNPIPPSTVSELLSSVLSKLMGLIAIVAIVFIVIGGIMYILSAGNTTMMTRAKNIWTGAVIGLAIALAAPTFLKEIREILGGGQTGGSAEAWVSNALTIKQIALNILKLLLSLVGILGIIAMVVGGGMLLTAYGEERRIDKGKAFIKYAIIGIVVSISALIVVREVASLLGAPAG